MSDNYLTLVGNPNTGKTSLFNTITGSFEHVGNWHGVTVEAKSKKVKIDNCVYVVVDLPGTYSLSSFSYEEQVTVDFLLNNKSKVINLCDANNMERNLYLTLQLIEAGLDVGVVVNFYDEIKNKFTLDLNQLSQALGISVVKVKATKKQSVRQAIDRLLTTVTQTKHLPYLDKIDTRHLQSLIQSKCDQLNIDSKFCAIKLLEQDQAMLQLINLEQDTYNQVVAYLKTRPNDLETIAKLRYDYIHLLLQSCQQKSTDFVYGKYKIDKIILNRYLALPIFLLILAGVFYITFSSVGSYLSQLIKDFINNYIGLPLNNFLLRYNTPLWVLDLVSVCIINGVGGLLSFLPQIVLLFMFLSFMEDSGYLSRLAFALEDVFCKIGLSGKSVFTLLMGLGCATSAVMTSRNLEDKNAKIKTALITPYMSCSAKLPIYAVLGGTFFGAKNIWLIFGLYVLGFVVAIIISTLLDKTVLSNKSLSFILEFAPYRIPNFKRVCYTIYTNCKQFVIKVGSLLFSLSVIVWILQNFTFDFRYVLTSGGKSMLQQVCEFIAPLLAPIGLNNWGIVSSLLAGFVAKEMIVSTFCIINNVPSSSNLVASLGATFVASTSVIQFSPLTSVVFMIFALLYVPCLSTLSVLKQEVGLKWTIFAVVLQLVIAYSICLVVYNVGLLSMHTNTVKSLITLVALAIIIFSLCFASKKATSKKCPSGCVGCSKKCGKFRQ